MLAVLGVAFILLAVLGGPASAQTLAQWDVNLAQIETSAEAEDLDQDALDALRLRLDEIKASITDFLAERQKALEPLQLRFDSRTAQNEGETDEQDAQTARLKADIDERVEEISAAESLLARIDAQSEALVERRRDLFTSEILARGPGVIDPGVWLRGSEAVLRKADQVWQDLVRGFGGAGERGLLRLLLPILVMVGFVVLIFRLKRWAEGALVGRITGDETIRHRASTGVLLTLIRLLVPAACVLLIVGALLDNLASVPQAQGFVTASAMVGLVVIMAYGLSGAFFAPKEPALRLSRCDDATAREAQRRIAILASVVGIDLALQVISEDGVRLPVEALVLTNTALLTVGGVSLWIAATLLRPDVPEEDEEGRASPLLPMILNVLRFVARVAAVAAPVLAFLGYYEGSRFAFYPIVFSGAVLGLCTLLFYMVRDGVEEMLPRESEESRSSRIRLIPIFVGLMLFSGAVPVLALIWGASLTDLAIWWDRIKNGLTVGDITISPIDTLAFLFVFAIGYVLTRILQGVLSRSVLPLTGLDSGGRDAITAGVGYLGVIVASLVAISATGLDLSNIAIVAGALSVGIGFGLQNIVNNFVSGVILLIERPIKAGDWVELSSGMGYVKRVNVRSTEVQTFDRSTLFVPNSELISSPVINWTHSDMHGRIIVPIGVAYGTDPRRVETILQQIADAHTMVLKRPAPYVLFRGFGADSLDFEIRGVLRDVNWILNVQSDINFEIARRFEEEGIEIPFAQRDVTIKNMAEMGEGIARAATLSRAPLQEPGEGPRTAAGPKDDGDGD